MTLGTQGCTEDDQILGYAGMDNIHCPHSTTSIIEDPFIGFSVDPWRMSNRKTVNYMIDYSLSIVWTRDGDGFLRELVKSRMVKDVPSMLEEDPNKYFRFSINYRRVKP